MKSQNRYSFTLLELIISLVVIGIVATSFPYILQSTLTSSKTSIKEETFYQEFSLLNLIAVLYFDENNTIGDNYYKDLNATKGDSELLIQRFGDELNRIGKHQMQNNDFRSGTNASVSKIGRDSGEDSEDKYDDIDDFDGYEENLTSFGKVTLKVKVKYIEDNATYYKNNFNFGFDYKRRVSNSNIKLIKVYANVDGKEIAIFYPSCNIGATKYLSLEDL